MSCATSLPELSHGPRLPKRPLHASHWRITVMAAHDRWNVWYWWLSFVRTVPSLGLFLYQNCPCIRVVILSGLSLYQLCPYIRAALLLKLSFYKACLFIADVPLKELFVRNVPWLLLSLEKSCFSPASWVLGLLLSELLLYQSSCVIRALVWLYQGSCVISTRALSLLLLY